MLTKKGHDKVAIAEKRGKPRISRQEIPEGELEPIKA